MRSRVLVVAAVFITLSVLAAVGSEERAAIGKLRSEIAQAFAGRSAAGMAKLWAEDGVLVMPAGAEMSGRGKVEKVFADTLKGSRPDSRLRLNIQDFRFPSDGVVEVDVSYEMTGVPNIATEERGGIYTVVFAKRDGKWRVSKASPKGKPKGKG